MHFNLKNIYSVVYIFFHFEPYLKTYGTFLLLKIHITKTKQPFNHLLNADSKNPKSPVEVILLTPALKFHPLSLSHTHPDFVKIHP